MTQLGNLSPEGSIAVGVIVCLLSSGIQSLGLTLQRKSHMLEETRYFDSPRPPYKRRRWQLGFSLFLIANLVGSTIQLSILPLPVLAALQAAGLVFNSINATWILGEAFTRWSLLGTILVSGGALLIAYFGALPEPAHSLGQLLALFVRGPFIAWAVVQVLLILTVFGVVYLLRRLSPSRGQSKGTRLSRGMCYGALSGILSAHSLLMAKSAVELLVRTVVDGENQFAHWQSWIILLALIAIGLSQLYCLHSGLQLCSTSVLYPFVFCVYNVITISDGLIYFNQGSQLTGLDSGLIVLGTFILLGGVFCLSWRLAEDEDGAPQPPEISENPLTPPVGVIGTPVSPYDIRRGTEREPLLSRSPSDEIPAPFSFRPIRAANRAKGQNLNDEEASVGLVLDSAEHDMPRDLKLAKTRKRATFADFGSMTSAVERVRASRSPTLESKRRPSVLSLYTRTRNRRLSMADNRALWGELEEEDMPTSGNPMARSEGPDSVSRRRTAAGTAGRSWRRMSEGSNQLLGRFSAKPAILQPAARNASDADGGSRKTSSSSGVKHGDPGQVVDDGDDDDEHDHMASSVPLLQRTETGRTYRVLSPEARRRRSSAPEGKKPNAEARRRLLQESADGDWHTIDSSRGRPSDDDDDDDDGDGDADGDIEEGGEDGRRRRRGGRRRTADDSRGWGLGAWKDWIFRKSRDDDADNG